ncbi:TPA: hypothetical protein OFW74_004520, partial [Escherichia coli]|nr:hypothetical protein [Escherichia coli]
EKSMFNDIEVIIIPVPANMTLSESVLYSLNIIYESYNDNEKLFILHGDTLISHLHLEGDIIAVAQSDADYNWEKEKVDNFVWCGYFSFSRPKTFIKYLTLSKDSFVHAVRKYDEKYPLKRIHVDDWLDLGHLNTYFLSRSRITTQRAFNSMRINSGIVWKSGENSKKIEAEAYWFKNIPSMMKIFTPQLIEDGIDSKTKKYYYSLEYLPFNPLNEIFVHGRNSVIFWSKIFNILKDFMNISAIQFEQFSTKSLIGKIHKDSELLYYDKTISRLENYCKKADISIHNPVIYDSVTLPSISEIAIDCINRNSLLPVIPSILHGDLCFSNILLNSRLDRIKVIDPRGMNQLGELTIFGDQKYDLAKLSHSVIGLYDHIISGRYKLSGDIFSSVKIDFSTNEIVDDIQREFMSRRFISFINTQDIMPLTVLLFLSMLPLHADRPDRQKAMLANALRLYSTFIYRN